MPITVIPSSGGGGGGGGSGESLTQDINETTHGFDVEDLIYRTASGYALSDSSVDATAEMFGFVTVDTDANNFTVTTSGLVENLTGKVAGTIYYMSETAGEITSTEPVSPAISKPVLLGLSTTTGLILDHRGMTRTADLALPIGFAVSNETSALLVGTSKVTFRMPHAMELTEVRANVKTAPTGADIIVDINASGSTIMTTDKLEIDAGEKTSQTAATPPVITTTSLADDEEITIDIDQIGSTIAGAGLKIWLIGTRP